MDRQKVMAQLEAISALAACIRAELAGPQEEVPAGLACPKCGHEERLEDTSTPDGPRMTCLECGTSWRP